MLSPKWNCLQKKTFSLKQKNNIRGSFSEHIEILFTFRRIFGESNTKIRKATERRDSMVKRKKTPFGGKGLVKILWDSTCMRVMWKLFNTFGWILKNYRNALLHRVDQLVRNAKNETLFYLSELGIRHILNDIIL